MMLVMAVVLSACAGSRHADRRPAQKEAFDPQDLDDDDLLSRSERPVPSTVETRPEAPAQPDVQTSGVEGRSLVDGYRVQLIASSSQETAERVRSQAVRQFEVAAYVEYHPPFYKVMIGDCRNRDEADALVEVAKAKGYASPLRVQTDVWVQDSGPKEIPGWRVQVYANTDLRTAQKVRQEALGRLGQAVYIEFIEPYYRVRAGDCRTEEEAREVARKAKESGYPDAFPVRGRITVLR